MAVIIATKKDPFQEKFKNRAVRAARMGAIGLPRDFSHVRRPFRGIVIKEDTYATLEVVEADGTPIPLFDSGARQPLKQIEGMIRGDTFAEMLEAQGVSDKQASKQQLRREVEEAESSNKALLRRPVSSIAQRTLSELKAKNESLKQFATGAGLSLRYSNFLLNGATEQRNEKYQIMETFGQPFIFFFGERPRIYNFSGVLLNSADFQWRAEFWANYDEVFRGTRLVERNARATLSWDDILVEGYVLGATAQESSQSPNMIQFQFQMFITAYQSLTEIGSTSFPRPAAVSIDTSLLKEDKQAQANLKNPSITNVDIMRRKNLEAGAQKGSTGLLGYMAMGLAAAGAVASMITNGLENFVKGYETLSAGRDIRYPVGAFPLAEDLQNNPRTAALLKGTNPFDLPDKIVAALAEGISPETRRLIEGGASDPAGLPQFFVQDQSLIINLTNKYNKNAYRRIKILPPSGVFVRPQNDSYYGGRISDAVDEYIENTVVSVNTPTDIKFSEGRDWVGEDLHFRDVIENMIKQLRYYGVPLSQDDLIGHEIKRKGQEAVLRTSLVGGSFAATEAKKAARKWKVPNVNPLRPAPDEEDVKEAQAAAQAIVGKSTPASSPKADLSGNATGTAETVKVITPDGVKERPRVKQRPKITPPSTNDPEADQATLERLLKEARRRAAR